MFQSTHYQAIFAQNQLHDFDAIWAREIDWFEAPNERRGGWSGVGKLLLQSDNGQTLSVFVKKQQNHGRKSLRHPIVGEPTFRREFKNLTFLAMHNIGAPKVVYYAEKTATKQQQAILITLDLVDFVPLDSIHLSNLNELKQTQLLQTVAAEVKRFHNTGMVHRALYPKHIFVKNAQNIATEFAFIDLEKARFSPLSWYRADFDLAAFFRHVIGWSDAHKLLFIKTYLKKNQFSFFDKIHYQMILRRANR